MSPQALSSPAFRKGKTLQYLREYGLDPQRVVIEVTETDKVSSYDDLRVALTHYREMGFRVALDDLGSGYSGLRLWSELQPHFVKIDKYFIRDVHRDSVKANFLRSISQMATATQCQVIAEGVEVEDEMRMLLGLRIPVMQGFYFARPSAIPPLDVSLSLPADSPAPPRPLRDNHTVLRITRRVACEKPSTRVEQVLARFQQSSELQMLPIVDEGLALGLVDRQRFFARLLAELCQGKGMQLGHIGGDDFLLVCESVGEESTLCERLFARFQHGVAAFYSPEHVSAGGIQASDRHGRACLYPLLSVSAGIVPAASTQSCLSHLQISDLASEAKKYAKAKGGCSFFVNHRCPA